MKLTRRDAILAIAGGGTAGYALREAAADGEDATDPDAPDLDADDIATLVSVAEVVYPSEVEVTAEFVSRYVDGFGPGRRGRIQDAIADLNDQSRSWHGSPFRSATPPDREVLLRRIGVDAVQPRPDGTVAERVRYYLVNGLLYALFTTPKGSRLVGIEEPKGHPGGYAAYRSEGPK